MKKVMAITVVVCCISLVSCQTTAQKNAASIVENFSLMLEKEKICLNKIYSNSAYQPLRARISNNPTLTQLTDNGLPTDEEQKLIIAEHNDQAECRMVLIEGLMNSIPGLIPVFVQYYNTNDLILADLIERKINWGAANKRFKASFLELQTQAVSTVKQLERELSASHNSELAQRQAAYNSFRQWNQNQQALRQNQQMIDSLNRPVITDCTRFGNSVNCTSR